MTRYLRVVWACFALLFIVPAHAAEQWIVRAGKLIDVERGRVLEDQAIRIDGDRIVGIGDFDAGANVTGRVIDWTAFTVLPGLMDTGALQRVFKDRSRRQGISEAEVKTQMAASVPAKRLGTADDFGPLCAFLCSRQAGYITGQNICVDGGLVKSLI